MDLDALRVFVKIAELGSFTRASQHLAMSKARASIRIQELEAAIGSRLLHRSTRTVRLTTDGEQFLLRARRLVLDADELATMFSAPSGLRGRVRLDLPVQFARNIVIPRLPEFLASHPQLEILVSTTDRRVDLLREGFDLVMRVGALSDSTLVAKRIGVLEMMNCASPRYLEKYGTPRTLADLKQHLVVHYSLTFAGETASFEYFDGSDYRDLEMRCALTVNSTDAYQAACLAGLGIIQAPRSGAAASIASGGLVEILPELRAAPLPVSLVQGHSRQARAPVRALIAWLTQIMTPHLS
ncbi:MAG TPA: LysR family transcriptional regulator [Polyangiaceae bacterium]|nr:LysR family transcriptional regulator [Polyangiaceae bacterium]